MSERSERDTIRGNSIEIGDICWRVSETVLGVDNAKSVICLMYIYILSMYGLYVCPLTHSPAQAPIGAQG